MANRIAKRLDEAIARGKDWASQRIEVMKELQAIRKAIEEAIAAGRTPQL